MNTRIFYWLFVIAWALLCWWWYVCQIKQVCHGESRQAAAIETSVQAEEPLQPPVEISTTSDEPDPVLDMNEVQIEEVAEKVIIHYPFNKAVKEDDQKIDAYLKRLAENMKASGQKVLISGHTDSVGDSKSNADVSERRAKIIRDILKNYGVSADQIKVEWFGERQPKASNDSPEGRYANRRVELLLQ